MSQLNEKLAEIKNNGFVIAPFQVMGEAFTYYKKTFFMVISTVILMVAAASILGSFILSNILEIDPASTPEQIQLQILEFTNQLLTPPYFYYYLAVFAVVNALSSILIAGYYKINAEVHLGLSPKYGSVFKYFISIKGLYIFITQLLISIVFILITIPLKSQNLEMVSMAINWLINTLTIFAIPLIIFGKMKPLNALKTSIMVVNKQPIPIILTVILNYFFLMSGLLFFFVGVLVVLPFLFSVYFTLYKQVIDFNLEEN